MCKVVTKKNLTDFNEIKENLAFWLTKSRAERISAVEHLRKQYHGDTIRLQRVVRVFQRS